MAKLQMEIVANAGYGADQVKGVTVADLRAMLEDFEDDDEVILHDEGNRYGAAYGKITSSYLEEVEAEEDIDEYLRNKRS